MTDVYCESCKEPWDPYYVVYNEGLPFEPLTTITVDDWKITWGGDQDAAAVGELLIHRCPCCKSDEEVADDDTPTV